MKNTFASLVLLGVTGSVYALDATVDPRSIAMGGAGVATANGYNAVYQNPAALAGLGKERFTMEAPFAVRVLDEGELSKNLDTLNFAANNLSNALSAYQSVPNQTNALQASDALTSFSNSMALVSQKSLMGSLYGGAFIAVPGPNFAFALKMDARAEFGGYFNYASSDKTQIDNINTNLASCAASGAGCATLAAVTGGKIDNLTSDFNMRGVFIGELGLTGARHFDHFGGIDLGITPKFMKVTTFDNVANAQSGNSNADSTSANQRTESVFNFDLGATKRYSNENGHNITTGVVIKNIIPKTIKTGLGNNVEIAPQITLGGAYGANWITATLDVDMLKNKALITGITRESQYMRLGTELDALGWAQLRLGYRHDLAGNYAGIPSVGLGLNLKLINIDLSVASAGKKETVAALQIGTHF